eukprot:3352165-Rhodomonas_salina.1
MERLPRRHLRVERGDDVRRGSQVGVRELVELAPALRDEGAALLHDSVEPSDDEEQLALGLGALERLGAPHRERVLHVLLQPGRSLKRHLHAPLQQDRREPVAAQVRSPPPQSSANLSSHGTTLGHGPGVWLGGEPEMERWVLLGVEELLLEFGKPIDHKVHILEAQPQAVLCRFVQQLDRSLRLPLSHRQLPVLARPQFLRSHASVTHLATATGTHSPEQGHLIAGLLEDG